MEIFVFYWLSAHKGLRLFRFCTVSWKDTQEPPIKRCMGTKIGVVQEYRNFDRIDGEPMEFEWNIFPGFNSLQLSQEVKSLLLRLGETPENFTGRIIFMSMFNDISCESRDNEKECESKCSTRFSVCKEIWNGTMVISRSWFREEVVFYR